MYPAQDLFGRVTERLARPLSGGAFHGRFQTAGVEGEVVGGPFVKVQTHHGHVVARKFRRGVGDLAAVPRRLDGDVEADCVDHQARVVNTAG